MRFTSHSLQETSAIAAQIVGDLSHKKTKSEATLVCLSGHLGAGKTTFVQAVAKHLGVVEEITSPTFVIMKQYPLRHAPWSQLIHIDAYRLESGSELQMLDFEKLVADPRNIILIEWPENVKEILAGAKDKTVITFELAERNDERILTVS